MTPVERRMTQLDDNTPPVVLIEVAHTIHCFSSDARWADRLPGNVYRLIAWLSLTELPEHDAAAAISKLSRNSLHADDFGARTLDLVQGWLSKYGLELRA
jgi:hypothetical protein